MRGPYQEARRVPHALQGVPPNPFGHTWQVILFPHDGPPITCAPGKSTREATSNAMTYIYENMKGYTL